ncbi:MAG TPA: ABC transporter ATP-binding protein [Acidimicrobiaceae bacterium]|nr:ABC transporter ATP-binding protein [Acidimicrobiaceae bacterium]HCV33556.1 ABC transporter ATP-binding protein [Acidimicrobiaceae bacterium]
MNIRSDRIDDVSPSGLIVRGLSVAYDGPPVLTDLSLEIAPGELVALLGPSGCGKTTLLRTIAGLEHPNNGEVTVGKRVVTNERIFVPPERRRIGMVFQDGALFPHLDVRRNIAYGLPREQRKSGRVEEALKMVGLLEVADRMPGTLSGGQQQRVALARALAPRPGVLLLDEPFSNLDTTLRLRVRAEIHRLLVDLGVTTVFVTHDQEEAFVLGDKVAVLHNGRLAQVGTPEELYRRPANRWVAKFVGDANLFRCHRPAGSCDTPVGPVPVLVASDGPADLLLRPEDLAMADGDIGTVELIEYYGHDAMVHVQLDNGPAIKVRTDADSSHQRGDRVDVTYVGEGAVALGL